MMGMILASGRLTCDNLEKKHVKNSNDYLFITIIVHKYEIYWSWKGDKMV